MRILVLNADYPRFLSWFYGRQPGLEKTPYRTQMARRNESLFGVADFYSLHAFGYYWYVFNIADVAIVAGVALLLYDSLRGSRKDAANSL